MRQAVGNDDNDGDDGGNGSSDRSGNGSSDGGGNGGGSSSGNGGSRSGGGSGGGSSRNGGDTADRIEKCFRELLGQSDYRSVSVMGVCERAGVSRKTFYVYYHDRQEIIERVFDREVMRPSYELLELLGFSQLQRLQPTMHERQFKSICEDGAFYRKLIVPRRGGDEAFLNVARTGFYGMNREILGRVGYQGTDRKLDYTAYYFASAKADLLAKWIHDDYSMPASQLARLYEKVALPFWSSLGGGGGRKPSL